MYEAPDLEAGKGVLRATTMARIEHSQESDRFGIWQELERALSIVHVAGLELVAEIGVGGEQPESVTRQRFEEALKDFHDLLSVLGMLPDSFG